MIELTHLKEIGKADRLPKSTDRNTKMSSVWSWYGNHENYKNKKRRN